MRSCSSAVPMWIGRYMYRLGAWVWATHTLGLQYSTCDRERQTEKLTFWLSAKSRISKMDGWLCLCWHLKARKTGRSRFLNPSYCALDMIRPPPCSDLRALFQSSRYAISVQCKPYPSPSSSFKDDYWISFGCVLKVQRTSTKRRKGKDTTLVLEFLFVAVQWESSNDLMGSCLV